MKKITLQKLRQEKKLTQEQASKVFSITKEYLSMLENGDRNPSDLLKEKMARLYECEISEIFLAINSTKRLKQQKQNTVKTLDKIKK